ncbi:MAG: ATP synthase subunit I [Faecalibacterium sp.]|jgi:hypothetical protein|nr:ATP synthase subunit I [Faecalibacterium sp.]
MKLQADSKKELIHIACGTTLLTVVMFVLFAALHLVGWAPFDYKVVLGGVVGAVIAIGNFAGLCLMVQKAIEEPDEKHRKAMIQLSYNIRLLLQAAWVVVAIAAPCFQFVAGILPLAFPRMTIYYLQITGRYQPAKPKGEEVSVEEDEPARPAENVQANVPPCEKGGDK